MATIISEVDIAPAKIAIRSDGIMHVHIRADIEITLEESLLIFQTRTELAKNVKYPILYTAPKFVIPSKEVREFVASQERSKLVIANAFVINSLPQRIIAKSFIKLNKPVRPTDYFDTEAEAVAWLKTFIR